MAIDLSVEVAGIRLRNPLVLVSGTCGYGDEMLSLEGFELGAIGAVVLKGITLKPLAGNPPPRLVETTGGLINSIGLENRGLDDFLSHRLPVLAQFDAPVIAQIAGHRKSEYPRLAEALCTRPELAAIEVNISCPNLERGGLAFGTNPETAAEVIASVGDVAGEKPLIAKLAPAVAELGDVALACLEAGAKAISLINTLPALAIDVETQRPLLGNNTGGLSGPAIKPVALHKVHEVAEAIRAAGRSEAIIGMGGIWTWTDAVEFHLAGATAIGLGTVNFANPLAYQGILDGLTGYIKQGGYESVRSLIGGLQLNTRHAWDS